MKQFRFENLILIAIYICVFPMGFKVSLALNKLFDYMSEIVASIWSMCMVYLLVGVLCAGFAVLLDRIEERVKSVSRKGGEYNFIYSKLEHNNRIFFGIRCKCYFF